MTTVKGKEMLDADGEVLTEEDDGDSDWETVDEDDEKGKLEKEERYLLWPSCSCSACADINMDDSSDHCDAVCHDLDDDINSDSDIFQSSDGKSECPEDYNSDIGDGSEKCFSDTYTGEECDSSMNKDINASGDTFTNIAESKKCLISVAKPCPEDLEFAGEDISEKMTDVEEENLLCPESEILEDDHSDRETIEDVYNDDDDDDDDDYYHFGCLAGCSRFTPCPPVFFGHPFDENCNCYLCKVKRGHVPGSDSENSLLSSDSEGDDKVFQCPSDYDSDIGEEMEAALVDIGKEHAKTNNNFEGHDDSASGTPESEVCLKSRTSPKDFNLARKETLEKPEEKNCLWLKLNELIFDQDGAGILKWFDDVDPTMRVNEYCRRFVHPVSLATRISSVMFDFLLRESFAVGLNKHPLHESAVHGQFPVVSHLLKNGVDVDVVNDSGATALHILASQPEDTSQMMRYLLSKGASINQADSEGYSPLFLAVQYGATKNVTALLGGGASLDQVTKTNRTVFQIAVSRSFKMAVYIYKARIHQGKYDLHELLLTVQSSCVNVARFLLRMNARCNDEILNGKSLIGHAAYNNRVPQRLQMIDLLFKAGYKMNKDEKAIRFEACQCPRGHLLRKVFIKNLTRPKSLQMLAIYKIRSLLGPSLPVTIHKLPLPSSLKQDVQLKHI